MHSVWEHLANQDLLPTRYTTRDDSNSFNRQKQIHELSCFHPKPLVPLIASHLPLTLSDSGSPSSPVFITQ